MLTETAEVMSAAREETALATLGREALLAAAPRDDACDRIGARREDSAAARAEGAAFAADALFPVAAASRDDTTDCSAGKRPLIAEVALASRDDAADCTLD